VPVTRPSRLPGFYVFSATEAADLLIHKLAVQQSYLRAMDTVIWVPQQPSCKMAEN